MKSTVWGLLAWAAVSLAGCEQKSKEQPEPALTPREQLLTTDTWYLVGDEETVAPAGTSTDVLETYELCQHDDFLRFRSDKTLEYEGGALACTAAAARAGRWALSADQNTLTITDPQTGSPVEYAVQEATASALRLRTSRSSGGTTVVRDYRYARTGIDVNDPTRLLTGRRWRLTAVTSTANGTATTDLYATLAACEKDDFLRFQRNGIALQEAGVLKCDPNEPASIPFAWNFASSSTLRMGLSGQVRTYDLVSLSYTTLKLRFTDTFGNNFYTYNFTYTAF
ncbi:hypothetical protein GCM10027048_10180 [Hymenobacter coalescens]